MEGGGWSPSVSARRGSGWEPLGQRQGGQGNLEVQEANAKKTWRIGDAQVNRAAVSLLFGEE